jgi:recombination protein RecA
VAATGGDGVSKADEQRRIVERASALVRKTYGENSSDRADRVLAYPSIFASTGSIVLDRAITGHLPGGIAFGPKRGRVYHGFGDPSLGKSVIGDMIVWHVQSDLNGYNLISETEGSRDAHFADALGTDLERVEIQMAPHTIERMFDMGIDYHDSVRATDKTTPFFWLIDSLETVASGRTFGVKMSGKQGGVYEYGGGRAGAIGDGLRRLADLCAQYPTSVLLLNQVRERPGVMFGDSKTPTGGKSPRFLASAEFKLSASKFGVVDGGNGRGAGRWVHAKIVKNKTASPYAQCEFYIDFQKGLHKWAGLIEALDAEGIVAIKHNPKGQFTGTEFTVRKTGEVLPIGEFTTWVQREKILEK